MHCFATRRQPHVQICTAVRCLSLTTRLFNSTLLFTILFSTFLLAFVNWGGLLACNSESACSAVRGVRHNALHE